MRCADDQTASVTAPVPKVITGGPSLVRSGTSVPPGLVDRPVGWGRRALDTEIPTR
jgi:hypothetical protein